MDAKDVTLATVSKFTEEQAREYLESIRWPKGADCAHCGSPKVTKLGGKAAKLGLYKCRDCRKKFTVMVGTIFEDSHIPLRSWVIAFHMMCSSKKGYSAKQLQRNLGLKSYKSAWHMAHRIRYAMKQETFAEPLKGMVEVDETYVGGKFRAGTLAVRPGERPKDRLASTTNKAPVVSLVERGGSVRSIHVADVTGENLKQVLAEHVDPTAHVMTDEAALYKWVGKRHARHSTVNHSAKEYARRDADGTVITTNTVEGYFSLLKRGVYGTFHNISKQHLHRYLDEFDFRYNARKITDGERTALAVQGAEGRRLSYQPLCGSKQN
jgi:transposase-like protein